MSFHPQATWTLCFSFFSSFSLSRFVANSLNFLQHSFFQRYHPVHVFTYSRSVHFWYSAFMVQPSCSFPTCPLCTESASTLHLLWTLPRIQARPILSPSHLISLTSHSVDYTNCLNLFPTNLSGQQHTIFQFLFSHSLTSFLSWLGSGLPYSSSLSFQFWNLLMFL